MLWVYLSFLPPLLYAISNYIDKIILSKYANNGDVGGVFIISGLVGVVAIPALLIFSSASITDIALTDALLMIFQGAFLHLYLLPYFMAMQKDEPSKVIPLFQMIPVFCLLLEYLFLGTRVTNQQLLGVLIIVFAGVLISTNKKEGSLIPQCQTFMLMLLSCLIISIAMVLFKSVGANQNFWTISCFSYVGSTLLSFGFLKYHERYRRNFFALFNNRSSSLMMLNGVNEVLAVVAGLVFTYCFTVLMAPIALVSAISGTQPVFVFLIGIFLTIAIPSLYKELLTKQILFRKLILILLITFGAFLIPN